MPDNNQTINYNQVEAIARAERRVDKAVDSVFTDTPAVHAIMGSGAVGRRVFGSEYKTLNEGSRTFKNGVKLNGRMAFEWPVLLEKLSGAVTGSGVQTISNTPIDQTSIARMKITKRYQPVAIPEDEYKAITSRSGNRGSKVMDLLDLFEEKYTSSVKTILEGLAVDFLGENIDSQYDSQFVSLSAGIGNATPDTTTYAGISRADYPVWAGNYAAHTAANISDASTNDFILKVMAARVLKCITNGANVSNLMMIVDSQLYTAFHDALMYVDSSSTSTNFRTDPKNGAGIPGWTGLSWSNVPIMLDPFQTANKMTTIDLSKVGYFPLGKDIFDMDKNSEWTPGENSTVRWKRMAIMGQLIVTLPRVNGIDYWS